MHFMAYQTATINDCAARRKLPRVSSTSGARAEICAEPVRIARVLTRPGVGGAAKHVALLMRGLADDFESRLYCGPPDAREGDYFALHDLKLHPQQIGSLRRDAAPARELRALRDLTRHFRQFRPHICDTHLSKAGVLGRLAARLAGVPIRIHTFHVNIFEGYDWRPFERPLYLNLERFAARGSDRLICLSDELGAQLLALGIGEKSQYRSITLGVDLTPFAADDAQVQGARAQIRAELKLPHDTPLVGIVARLAPVKSIKTALETAALLGVTRPDVHFVFVGEGPSRARLQTLARELGVSNRVHFLGLRSDIARLNWAFDCVLLPSLQEGTPISIIENLAAARPVVATDVGGVGRLIEHETTGLLIPPRDPAAATRSITRVLSEPERARSWGECGRQLVRREWSLERMLEQHRALYREIWEEKCG